MRKAAKAKANGNGNGNGNGLGAKLASGVKPKSTSKKTTASKPKPKKKKSNFPIKKGYTHIYSAEGKLVGTQKTSDFRKMKGSDSSVLKKVPGGVMYKKKVADSRYGINVSGRSTKNPSGTQHTSEINRKKAANKNK